ncbi:PREDICTED: C-type lectin domain family 4 member M-like [Priapulus caudatus]|uniref:C-type lectin domain family 4 member M-like n=1 Tax=Priapulus caudatus TaxID=37621 RepID=A0ABM1ES49_PRICU|nr:PREDICTED: C-type lectin domain family 4 member M-like [Priapulus caudatus]
MSQCAFFCVRTPGCTGYNIENTAATQKHCELSAYAETDVGAAVVTENNYDFYTKVNSGECPADFIEFRGNCYYIETLNTKTWLEARDHCISMGADHVSLESQGEINFLTRQHPRNWWTGGNHIAADTPWVWAATGRQVDMCAPIPWLPGEPTNNDLEIYMYATTSYQRNDAGKYVSSYYICEKST